MIDREKVIKGLECCTVPQGFCEKCPYETEGFVADCTSELAKDALAILKEQEAVEPTWSRGKPFCGVCGLRIHGGKFCSECGKPILWEGQ